MEDNIRIVIKPKDLTKLSDENLFILLEDLQKTSESIFMEGWRRGIHTDLAKHAMKFKAEGPKH